jgi:hypothetical protein
MEESWTDNDIEVPMEPNEEMEDAEQTFQVSTPPSFVTKKKRCFDNQQQPGPCLQTTHSNRQQQNQRVLHSRHHPCSCTASLKSTSEKPKFKHCTFFKLRTAKIKADTLMDQE